jgi:hypothetical protein
MTMAANHTITRHDPDNYRADKLFTTDRRINGLDINIPAHASHVVTVSDDDDQLDDALRAAGADLLGGQYGHARAGFVRHPLRASSQGAGRARFR